MIDICLRLLCRRRQHTWHWLVRPFGRQGMPHRLSLRGGFPHGPRRRSPVPRKSRNLNIKKKGFGWLLGHAGGLTLIKFASTISQAQWPYKGDVGLVSTVTPEAHGTHSV